MNERHELSFTNPQVQRLRRLLGRRSSRWDDGAFVVEGATLIGEAQRAGWTIEAEYLAPGGEPASDAQATWLASGVIERVATTERPQPNLAVVAMPDRSIQMSDVDFVVVADRLADPGNLGTILRSAEAAGVGAVVLTPGSVDPFNPKVIRSSAGAVFHVPAVTASFSDVQAAGLRLVGTSSHHGAPHTNYDWAGRVAVVVGNEAHGLDNKSPVDDWVTIEHVGRAESLNVAMATTVVLFEASRARRRAATSSIEPVD